MTLLKLDDVHAYYDRSYVLQGVSLEVKKGEIVALLGRNGVGKTTTLNSIMGFVKPRAGKIFFGETDITPLPSFKIGRMGIGYVPQGRHLFPKMTVMENLKTGMLGRSGRSDLDRVFELFPNIRDRLQRKAGSLSGGEQQAVAISRAILKNPEVLILDEPTTGLMPLFVSSLKDIIRKLNDEGMTILLVEERVPFTLALADRVYFMVNGRIEYITTRKELAGRKDLLVRYLGVEA
ncbi:MAG: High-affinity branched-chain amino acid transport ATP-binding protein LivF [Syntrophorhabdaceae bacterium PtaU1.Bin034]|nr:MAG: High-affinity branched-chain amino acid transport ATP-binding protein LivF [Syntrophorhabdaceae bacterium PtaU1.Bin034]